MLELVFVIVVIGILASIAMPKLWVTRDDAIVVKGRSEVATLRSSIATSRQKNLLEGNSSYPGSLDSGTVGIVFDEVLDYPVYTKNSPGHWTKDAGQYYYHLGDGDVNFTYTPADGKFDCVHTDSNCKLLTE